MEYFFLCEGIFKSKNNELEKRTLYAEIEIWLHESLEETEIAEELVKDIFAFSIDIFFCSF